MQDHMIFSSREDAEQEIVQMAGWDARAVEWIDMDGKETWVIECGAPEHPLYMRDDGYVR